MLSELFKQNPNFSGGLKASRGHIKITAQTCGTRKVGKILEPATTTKPPLLSTIPESSTIPE